MHGCLGLDVSLKKMGLSLAVRVLTLPPLDSVGRQFAGDIVPVFMLHRFQHPELSPSHGHRPEFIRQVLQYLRRHQYSILGLDDVVRIARQGQPLPPKSVVFTIDDGFADQAEAGAPIFLEYDAPATIFLISGFIDGQLWPWDDQVSHAFDITRHSALSLDGVGFDWRFDWSGHSHVKQAVVDRIRDELKMLPHPRFEEALKQLFAALDVTVPAQPPQGYLPLSWNQARALEKKGIGFAAHTVSHRILSQLPDDQSSWEIETSSARVRSEMARPGQVFCYPTGRRQDFTVREQRLLQHHGYAGAVSTEPGYLEPLVGSENPFCIRRFAMPDTMPDFIQYCTWIEKVKGRLRSGV